MKRKLFPLALLLVVLTLGTFTACEEEPNILYPEVDPFDELLVAQNVAVVVMNGSQALSVSGSGDLNSVQFEVNDGLLSIALPNPGMAQNVVVEVYHDDLESVRATQNSLVNFPSAYTTSSPTLKLSAFNTASIYSHHALSVDTLDISLSDDSFVGFRELDVHTNTVTQWSGSLCFLEGTAVDQSIKMTGECHYNLADKETGWAFTTPLLAENTWVNSKEEAMAWVHVSSYLNAVGTTGSKVYYKGNPATIEENMTNGAELIQKEQ